VDILGYCGTTVAHKVCYYNIVYTDPVTLSEYYLYLSQDGFASFKLMKSLTESENTAAMKEQYKRLGDPTTNNAADAGFKFCFPYKLKRYNSIEYVDESKQDDPFYNTGKVFVQSRAIFNAAGTQTVDPVLLKVTMSTARLNGKNVGSLYDIDYTKELADTWFFGDNGSVDEVWVRLKGVDAPDKKTRNYLRDESRVAPSHYFVIRNSETEATAANGIKYGQISFINDIENTRTGGLKSAELVFQFIDSFYIGSYSKRKIWYYEIINAAGDNFIAAAPNKPSPAAYYTWQGEGYGYFGSKAGISNKYQYQFGLRYAPKAGQAIDPHTTPFWVVANVDWAKYGANPTDSLYYLSEKNERLTFRGAVGTTEQIRAIANPMIFNVWGLDPDGNLVGLDNVSTDGFNAYAIDGAVRVSNAEGVIRLYAVDGRLLKTVDAVGAVTTIPMAKGMVIVKNGANTVKVVVQ